ncbi:hypothetical protein VKT23_001264 [Stygiomarasmius scandens]|uniref:Uncharacterized protein n=1 Tax=Marasmiellus scandens TaxID=2682957 RepID=A0ABR1K9S4_9AGAR
MQLKLFRRLSQLVHRRTKSDSAATERGPPTQFVSSLSLNDVHASEQPFHPTLQSVLPPAPLMSPLIIHNSSFDSVTPQLSPPAHTVQPMPTSENATKVAAIHRRIREIQQDYHRVRASIDALQAEALQSKSASTSGITEQELEQCVKFADAVRAAGLDGLAHVHNSTHSSVQNFEEAAVDAIQEAADDPRGIWSKITDGVVGPRAPKEYISAIATIIRNRWESRAVRKARHFWKKAAKENPNNANIVTPSASNLSELIEALSPERQRAVEELLKKRHSFAPRSGDHPPEQVSNGTDVSTSQFSSSSMIHSMPLSTTFSPRSQDPFTSSGEISQTKHSIIEHPKVISSSNSRSSALPPLASQIFKQELISSHSSERFFSSPSYKQARPVFGNVDLNRTSKFPSEKSLGKQKLVLAVSGSENSFTASNSSGSMGIAVPSTDPMPYSGSQTSSAIASSDLASFSSDRPGSEQLGRPFVLALNKGDSQSFGPSSSSGNVRTERIKLVPAPSRESIPTTGSQSSSAVASSDLASFTSDPNLESGCPPSSNPSQIWSTNPSTNISEVSFMSAERALESFERICDGFPSSNFGESLHTISEESSGLGEGPASLTPSAPSSQLSSGAVDLADEISTGISVSRPKINRISKTSMSTSRRSFLSNRFSTQSSLGRHELDATLVVEEPELESKTETKVSDANKIIANEIEEVPRSPTPDQPRTGFIMMRSVSVRTPKIQQMHPQSFNEGVQLETSSMLPSPAISLPSSLPSLKQPSSSSSPKFPVLSSIPSRLSKFSFRSNTRDNKVGSKGLEPASLHSNSSPKRDLKSREKRTKEKQTLRTLIPVFKPVLPLKIVKKSKEDLRVSTSLPASPQGHFKVSPAF